MISTVNDLNERFEALSKSLDDKIKGADGIIAVTDSLSLAGTSAKEGIMGATEYIIEDGVCKSRDLKQLVGSVATMDVLVQNMVKAGVQLEHVLRMASETPARLMNVYDRKGSLEKGKDADILIIDAEQNVRAIWAMGKLVEGSNTLWK